SSGTAHHSLGTIRGVQRGGDLPLGTLPGGDLGRGEHGGRKFIALLVSLCFPVVIEDDRIDDVLQNLSEKAPPGV
uniref:Uncharacterized protein n=1 Tax=Zosterops lateralis melanops TaxID=1220523 RepID=A0A8D2P066_ZOSLA